MEPAKRSVLTLKGLWAKTSTPGGSDRSPVENKGAVARAKVFLSLPISEQLGELSRSVTEMERGGGTSALLIVDTWISTYQPPDKISIVAHDAAFVSEATVRCLVEAGQRLDISEEGLRRILQIVTILARSSENQSLFGSAGAMGMVVRALHISLSEPSHEWLLVTKDAIRALSNLTVLEENKILFVREDDALETLCNCLEQEGQKEKETGMLQDMFKVLRNLALNGTMSAAMLQEHRGLTLAVKLMAQHLEAEGVQYVACAMICNLTADDKSKEVVVKHNAVKQLLLAMQQHMSSVRVQTEGCKALGNIATHPEHKTMLMKEGATSVLLDCLRQHLANADVVENACRVLSYLAATRENIVSLHRGGILPPLLLAMTNHIKNARVQEHASAILANMAAVEEIRASVAAEGAVAAIQEGLAKHTHDVRLRLMATHALQRLGCSTEMLGSDSDENLSPHLQSLRLLLYSLPSDAFNKPSEIVAVVVSALRTRSCLFENSEEIAKSVALFATKPPSSAAAGAGAKDRDKRRTGDGSGGGEVADERLTTEMTRVVKEKLALFVPTLKELRAFPYRREEEEKRRSALSLLQEFNGCALLTPLQIWQLMRGQGGEETISPCAETGLHLLFETTSTSNIPPLSSFIGGEADTNYFPVPLLVFLRGQRDVKISLCSKDEVLAYSMLALGSVEGFEANVMTVQLKRGDKEYRLLLQVSLRSLSRDDLPCDRYGFPLDPRTLIAASASLKRSLQSELEMAPLVGIGAKGVGPQQAIALAMNGGLPAGYRALLWRQAVHRRHNAATFSAFPQALQAAQQLADTVAKQVEKDLERTFPLHQYFQSQTGIAALRRVLRAVAVETHVGYCQSMNFIAAVLLLIAEEDVAYWLLACVVKHILPEYFGYNLIGVQIDTRVIESVVVAELPLLKKHLDTLGFPISMLTSQWFMCLYIGSFPTETVLVVLDAFFTQGRDVLLAVALVLLRANDAVVRSLHDIEAVLLHFRKALSQTFDHRQLIQQANMVLGGGRIHAARMAEEEDVCDHVSDSETKHLLSHTHFTEDQILRLHVHYTNAGIASYLEMPPDASALQGETARGRARRLVDERGLTLSQFLSLLASFGMLTGTGDAWGHILFRAFDTNEDGSVDFKEMCTGFDRYAFGARSHLLFYAFDRGKKKKLSRADLRMCLDAICTRLFNTAAALDHTAFLDDAIGKGDGVDLASFVKLCEGSQMITQFMESLPDMVIPGDIEGERQRLLRFESLQRQRDEELELQQVQDEVEEEVDGEAEQEENIVEESTQDEKKAIEDQSEPTKEQIE